MMKWLFFDLGSTLIDESECDAFRLCGLLEQPQAPDRRELTQIMQQLASENRHPYKDAVKRFGLDSSNWPVHLEKLYPDSVFVLSQLAKRYRLGIIANQNPGTEARLEAFGIRQYFSVIASSSEVGVAKPDPEIFQAAMRAADCSVKEAVMIGDRLDNDIVPAAKLGMQTVWIRQGLFRFGDPDKLQLHPTYTIQSLPQLLTIL